MTAVFRHKDIVTSEEIIVFVKDMCAACVFNVRTVSCFILDYCFVNIQIVEREGYCIASSWDIYWTKVLYVPSWVNAILQKNITSVCLYGFIYAG